MKKIKEFIPYVIIFLVVICVKTFLIAPVQVVGDSMNPTLNDGDLMFLNKAIYKFRDIKRFDIVVLKSVNDPSKFLVKRVIGLPGDVISYENDKLFVNGKEVKEEFSHKDTYDFSLSELGKQKVSENSYFVVGDNRGNSRDSRIDGFIPFKNVIGKVNFVFFPFKNFGFKK